MLTDQHMLASLALVQTSEEESSDIQINYAVHFLKLANAITDGSSVSSNFPLSSNFSPTRLSFNQSNTLHQSGGAHGLKTSRNMKSNKNPLIQFNLPLTSTESSSMIAPQKS